MIDGLLCVWAIKVRWCVTGVRKAISLWLVCVQELSWAFQHSWQMCSFPFHYCSNTKRLGLNGRLSAELFLILTQPTGVQKEGSKLCLTTDIWPCYLQRPVIKARGLRFEPSPQRYTAKALDHKGAKELVLLSHAASFIKLDWCENHSWT